jgi:hypothetical protein
MWSIKYQKRYQPGVFANEIQPEETRGIDGDLEEGVYLTMVDGISDIMEDMEVSIICQQLYRAYVHTILIL